MMAYKTFRISERLSRRQATQMDILEICTWEDETFDGNKRSSYL